MSEINEKSPNTALASKHWTSTSSGRSSSSTSPHSSSHSSPSFLVWLVLHPSKPHFSLKQADINQLNLTAASSLTSYIQLTLLSTNPNKKVGIYYDQFLLYASYNGQKITNITAIDPFYQDREETNLLSASLVGSEQTVAPALAYQVKRDEGTGKVGLSFKVMGRLRWKVGTWISGRYRFNVNCVSVVAFGGRSVSSPAALMSLRQGTVCSTSV
ncbi:UNVERIFIED_CONTAM: NDR1/HIN1-like protein 26 [Sesamum latifolium]|uniref:NDR1/HIN1-like protein 26 n=1 Tax=Sesamum latifolium TaxID=2727402 RepID=A0AAW2XJI3_9LAMI